MTEEHCSWRGRAIGALKRCLDYLNPDEETGVPDLCREVSVLIQHGEETWPGNEAKWKQAHLDQAIQILDLDKKLRGTVEALHNILKKYPDKDVWIHRGWIALEESGLWSPKE